MTTRAKRLMYLIHRYTGVTACVFMALWFVSGIVMLFIGYPKLTPWERLGALPALAPTACCITTDKALSYSKDASQVRNITLTTIAGTPTFRIKEGDGTLYTVNATSGQLVSPVTVASAQTSAQQFLPGTDATPLGSITEDRWTHSGALNMHRPLFLFEMDDPNSTWLYVSSSTGEVVMDAPAPQRLWNYVGAWLHWLYMFRDKPADPGWSWIVIIISFVGLITSVAGIVVGIWRWRFTGRYKSGSKSPYQAFHLRWHHITGLLFSAIVLTWILSGFMSMNPFGIFNAREMRPDHHAYIGTSPGTTHLDIAPQAVISLLIQRGFHPREIAWRTLNGQPYLLAKDSHNHTRLVVSIDGHYAVLEQWPQTVLQQAAAHLMPVAISSVQTMMHEDAYYYARQPESMMGSSERRLPALLVHFDDPGQTRIYIDMHTGEPVLALDRSQRVGRWLFNFLHSWDLPVMLQTGMLRDIVLILLSIGGLALSVTGVVIGTQRVRLWLGKLTR